MKKFKTFFKTQLERKRHRRNIFRITAVAFLFVAIAVCSFIFYRREQNNISVDTARDLWDQSDYQGVYAVTQAVLEKKPFNNAALAYRGFSAFYLSAAETDLNLAQSYLDEAIMSMRRALYKADKRMIGQLSYMLGKAYFYRNTISAYHYYADLAADYLNKARELGFAAPDIPEFLGLSYAALGMTAESIAAFSEALPVRDSDTLKLAIAEQYYKNGQPAQAKPYLLVVAGNSADDVLVMKSRFLLGSISLEEGLFEDAQQKFQAITEMDPFSPDGYYGLGLLYEMRGDNPRARAEWRKALQYDVNHKGALLKLKDSR